MLIRNGHKMIVMTVDGIEKRSWLWSDANFQRAVAIGMRAKRMMNCWSVNIHYPNIWNHVCIL